MAPEPRVSVGQRRVAEGDFDFRRGDLERDRREVLNFFWLPSLFLFLGFLVYTLYFFHAFLLLSTYLLQHGRLQRGPRGLARLKVVHPWVGGVRELVQPVLAPLEQLEQIR